MAFPNAKRPRTVGARPLGTDHAGEPICFADCCLRSTELEALADMHMRLSADAVRADELFERGLLTEQYLESLQWRVSLWCQMVAETKR